MRRLSWNRLFQSTHVYSWQVCKQTHDILMLLVDSYSYVSFVSVSLLVDHCLHSNHCRRHLLPNTSTQSQCTSISVWWDFSIKYSNTCCEWHFFMMKTPSIRCYFFIYAQLGWIWMSRPCFITIYCPQKQNLHLLFPCNSWHICIILLTF